MVLYFPSPRRTGATNYQVHKVGGTNNRQRVSRPVVAPTRYAKREIHYSRLIAHESIGSDRARWNETITQVRRWQPGSVFEGLTLTDLTFRLLQTSVSSTKTKTSLPHSILCYSTLYIYCIHIYIETSIPRRKQRRFPFSNRAWPSRF